jgi:AAA+ ATPase superfamily predicted ATPase
MVDAERNIEGEFPSYTQARKVLSVIGAGETTFRRICTVAGMHSSEISRSLHLLIDKGVVAAERPLSVKPSRETRYRVEDPYLRYWLRFIQPHHDDIERGRGQLVASEIQASWPDYRGIAVEPLVREAVTRMLPNKQFGEARYVGGWWNRTNSVQIDLIGSESLKKPASISFTGSIKWRNRQRFSRRDTAELIAARANVPGITSNSLLVGVSRCGFDQNTGLDVELGPEELIAAYNFT